MDALRDLGTPSAQTFQALWRHECGALPRPRYVHVGVSGGADSLCALRLTIDWLSAWSSPPVITALHVHHGLHPQADAHAEHVVQLAESWGVRHEVYRLNLMPHHAGSVESQARHARYDIFEQLMWGAEHVLVLGHHADDVAETMLMRLGRGAGLDGLRGMPAVRSCGRGHLWRPFLRFRRCVLEHILRSRHIAWVHDPTNCETVHTRNGLRHKVLPVWSHVQPRITASLCGVARALNTTTSVHQELLQARLAPALDSTQCILTWSVIQNGSRELQIALLRHWITHIWGSPAPSQATLSNWVASMPGATSVCWHVPGWRASTKWLIRGYRGALYRVPWPEPPLQDRGIWGVWRDPVHHDLLDVRFYPPHGRQHTFKKRAQSWGIPPWRRGRIPLLYRDETLVGIWMGQGFKRCDRCDP